MSSTFQLIVDDRAYAVYPTREQASTCAVRLKSRGHIVWIEQIPGKAA